MVVVMMKVSLHLGKGGGVAFVGGNNCFAARGLVALLASVAMSTGWAIKQ